MEASENKGLALKVLKSESMTVPKNPKGSAHKLHIYGGPIKQVDKFQYPGYLLTFDGKCITAAKVTFKRLPQS